MNYRVTISDETLAGVEEFLNYIAEEQGSLLAATR